MKVTTIKKLTSLCKDHYKDDDGYWFILGDNWIADGYYSEKAIHEDTKNEVLEAIKTVNFKFVLR